jgi:hypothetical protein
MLDIFLIFHGMWFSVMGTFIEADVGLVCLSEIMSV